MDILHLLLTLLYQKYSSVAQSVEQLAVNQLVVGSSPTGGAFPEKAIKRSLFFIGLLMGFV